uniref:Activin_recp domain-containing protein n=1 Tax=Globodera pallida TaxID=36090 RepID=A0A183BS23_GLOPA
MPNQNECITLRGLPIVSKKICHLPQLCFVLELVLLLTIAVLVAFTPSADALRCSIGGQAEVEFNEDLLEVMESSLLKLDPSAGQFGQLERLKLLFKAVGIMKCPAGSKKCMRGTCSISLDSLGEEAIPYLQVFDERIEISFGACAPEEACNAGGHQELMAPFKCEYSCCVGNMCNGAIGLLHNCGTFATILATFYAFFFLRYSEKTKQPLSKNKQRKRKRESMKMDFNEIKN